MFAPLEKRSTALEERLLDMNTVICDKFGIKSEEDEMIEAMEGVVKTEGGGENKKGGGEEEFDSLWTPVGLPKQNKVVCVGRVCNEVSSCEIMLKEEGARGNEK